MSPSFTDDEIGKDVVTAAGDRVGEVTDVEDETAYVDPDPGLGDSIAAALDWGEASDRPLPVASGAVEAIRDETIELEAEYAPERGGGEGSAAGDTGPGGERGAETDAGEQTQYRQNETDLEPDAGGGTGAEDDAESGVGRQDETDLEPDDLDETDPELDGFDGTDPDVEGGSDDPALSDAAREIDGDRERRTDPTADPIEKAGGSGDAGTPSTESGTREDVDVDPTELTEENADGDPGA